MIPEQTINRTTERIEEMPDEEVAALMTQFKENQPAVMAYLFSESFHFLTAEEKVYLHFLALVIWQSINEHTRHIRVSTAQQLGEIEEQNWTLLQQSKARSFRDKLDVFFKNYQQEDLLAFVEDALIDETEGFLTKEGREPMFIALKSIIDVLCAQTSK